MTCVLFLSAAYLSRIKEIVMLRVEDLLTESAGVPLRVLVGQKPALHLEQKWTNSGLRECHGCVTEGRLNGPTWPSKWKLTSAPIQRAKRRFAVGGAPGASGGLSLWSVANQTLSGREGNMNYEGGKIITEEMWVL